MENRERNKRNTIEVLFKTNKKKNTNIFMLVRLLIKTKVYSRFEAAQGVPELQRTCELMYNTFQLF